MILRILFFGFPFIDLYNKSNFHILNFNIFNNLYYLIYGADTSILYCIIYFKLYVAIKSCVFEKILRS